MPKSRLPRPPSPRTRQRRANKNTWLDGELLRKISAMAALFDRQQAEERTHEKAPDLSTGGSFSSSDDSQN
jgi:hypothetical protein